jgi:hypothetical protein
MLFEMATDCQVIAQDANAPNRRSGCLGETLGRDIALRDFRKQVQLESSLDRSGLLKGENRIHEQVR